MKRDVYEFIYDRFSLTDGNLYICVGIWPKGRKPLASLNGRQLKAELLRSEPASAAERARDPDRDWGSKGTIAVALPGNLPEKGEVRIWLKNEEPGSGNGSGKKHARPKVWHAVSVKELRKRRGCPQYTIERILVEKDKVKIWGWAVSAAGLTEICARDESGRLIETVPRRTPRPDVEQIFLEAKKSRNNSTVKDRPGFYLEMPKPKGRILTVHISDGGTESVCEVDLWQAVIFGRKLIKYGKKSAYILKAYGTKALAEKVVGKVTSVRKDDVPYQKWAAMHAPTEQELEEQRKTKFDYAPLISIVVPLYKTQEKYLRELIGSIRAQTYGNWELVLSDGSGPDMDLRPAVKKAAAGDERVRCVKSPGSLRIAANTNQAIAAAAGEFIAFADHDDVLTPDALYHIAAALQDHPDAQVIYTDEDKMTADGRRLFLPHFKPDYNEHLLCTVNYICHLMAARRELLFSVEENGEILRDAFEGAQDYDLVFRLCEKVPREQILHVARVLYHWRAHRGSTADNPESKTYAFENGQKAIEAHYERLGKPARVWQGEYQGLYRTRFERDHDPLVTILIPNKDHVDMLRRCIDSIEEHSTYRNYEFLIVENNSTEAETFAFYDELEARSAGEQERKYRVITWEGEFSYAAIHNFAVPMARGEYVLLLNNDTEMINEDALEEMLGFAMEKEVGAVGARLYYEDDTVQHAGVVIGFGAIAGHCFVQQPRNATGYMHRIICTQEYSAVTAACMLIRKSVWDEVDGLCEELAIAFNDIDFCLKLRRAGYLVVYAPYAEFYHYESKSRGLEDTPEKIARFNWEAQVFEKRWPDILRDGDPYYNRNLTLKSQDFSLKS